MPLVYPEHLKKAILEHPDLPLVFFCDPEIWAEDSYATWPATSVSVRIGKVLSMKDNDTFMRTFTDEDEVCTKMKNPGLKHFTKPDMKATQRHVERSRNMRI